MIGCTTVSKSYLPFARVLAESWRRFHPDRPFVVLVIDADVTPPDSEAFEVLSPLDLDKPEEIRIQRAIYTAYELAIALKPKLLRVLLARGEGAAFYIDPDCDLYAPLADVGALAIERGVVVFPHFIAPVANDELVPNERVQNLLGVFNSGTLAVGPGAEPFLDWLGERMRRLCIDDQDQGLHCDQRWLDFVPSYFPHAVLRDPTIAAAWWNLHERALSWTGEAFTVNGSPLRLFHFGAFDPDDPERLTKDDVYFTTPFRPQAGDPEARRRLFRLYASRVIDSGYHAARNETYPFATSSSGLAFGAREATSARRAYRLAVLGAEAAGTQLPPDPFAPESRETFSRFMRRLRWHRGTRTATRRVLSCLPAPARRKLQAALRAKWSGSAVTGAILAWGLW